MMESFEEFLALDAQVHQARTVLQHISDLDPKFEQRVRELMQLVEERDRALAGPLPIH